MAWLVAYWDVDLERVMASVVSVFLTDKRKFLFICHFLFLDCTHLLLFRGCERDGRIHLLLRESYQGRFIAEAFSCLWMKSAVLVPSRATLPASSSSDKTTHVHTYRPLRQWAYRPFTMTSLADQPKSTTSIMWPRSVFVWALPPPPQLPSQAQG